MSDESAYDDGEGYSEGDPDPSTFTDEEWLAIGALQESIDKINSIENDDERRAAATVLWTELGQVDPESV